MPDAASCKFCGADILAGSVDFFPGYIQRCGEHDGAPICPACLYCQAADPSPEYITKAKARRAVYEQYVAPLMRENRRRIARMTKAHLN